MKQTDCARRFDSVGLLGLSSRLLCSVHFFGVFGDLRHNAG